MKLRVQATVEGSHRQKIAKQLLAFLAYTIKQWLIRPQFCHQGLLEDYPYSSKRK